MNWTHIESELRLFGLNPHDWRFNCQVISGVVKIWIENRREPSLRLHGRLIGGLLQDLRLVSI